MITILSIDPGVTTGYCVAQLAASNLTIHPSQDRHTLREIADLLNRTMRLSPTIDTHIVYEDFEYRSFSRAGLDLTPVKVIGVIELYVELYPFVPFYKQTAAMGKGYYTDDRLKELGIYKKGVPHGRDATRHLMHWLTFRAGAQFITDINDLTIRMN